MTEPRSKSSPEKPNISWLRRRRFERKSTKNPSKIDGNEAQIDEKSMKNNSWAVLGARSRFGDAPGRARDGSGTPKSRPRTDPGAPGATQERPGTAQKPLRAGPGTLLDGFGADPARAWCTERCRTRSRSDFSSFLRRRADAPMCFPTQFQWCFVDIRRNERTLRVHAE